MCGGPPCLLPSIPPPSLLTLDLSHTSQHHLDALHTVSSGHLTSVSTREHTVRDNQLIYTYMCMCVYIYTSWWLCLAAAVVRWCLLSATHTVYVSAVPPSQPHPCSIMIGRAAETCRYRCWCPWARAVCWWGRWWSPWAPAVCRGSGGVPGPGLCAGAAWGRWWSPWALAVCWGCVQGLGGDGGQASPPGFTSHLDADIDAMTVVNEEAQLPWSSAQA